MRPRTAESKFWQWKEGITVHYAKASKLPSDTAVVLLHGFGVASFHYEHQFAPLSQAGYTVYAMDNVGAGLSWPDRDPAPGGPQELQDVAGSQWGFGSPDPQYEDMVIGEDLWVQQIKDFISQLVAEPKVRPKTLTASFGCYRTKYTTPFGVIYVKMVFTKTLRWARVWK